MQQVITSNRGAKSLSSMADVLRALEKKYEGDIAVHTTNIQVYQENPAGIGEHSDIEPGLRLRT